MRNDKSGVLSIELVDFFVILEIDLEAILELFLSSIRNAIRIEIIGEIGADHIDLWLLDLA